MRLIGGGIRAASRRLRAAEDGFTMVITLGVMTVAMLLVTVAWVATNGDVQLTQRDQSQNRAYYAARAGVNDFLHRLAQNSNLWQTCPSQSTTAVPGSSTQTYSFKSLGANGFACNAANPIPSMIDSATGTFRMQFTGSSGTPSSSRDIVASFRRDSPLQFLWYTIYEVNDPVTQPDPASYAAACSKFHWQGRSSSCDIDWITGDRVDGPMFTEDQFAVCGNPVFGRDANDKIESTNDPIYYSRCAGSNPDVKGTLEPNSDDVPLPPFNTRLKTDAANYGAVYSGPTTIALNGSTATITPSGGSPSVVSLSDKPIIYVDSLPGCTPSYSPYTATYSSPPTGSCGDVYVSGTYSQPVTIAAANDIVISGDTTTAHANGVPSGPAMLGLVANNFVRVRHGCSNDTNIASTTTANLDVDAAILALNHSFIVDHYDCGNPLGTLTVNGAIAQKYRGTVGTHSGPTVNSGYLKDYAYDDRLKSQEPPYMFDIQNASWHIFRETLCTPGKDC